MRSKIRKLLVLGLELGFLYKTCNTKGVERDLKNMERLGEGWEYTPFIRNLAQGLVVKVPNC